MQTIVSSLRTRNITVDDSCLIGCIECALPDEFNEWLINWSMRESEPSINELISSINNYVETLKTTETKAMVAATENSASNSKVCRYCKKLGHEINECRKLKWKKDEQQVKNFEIAMMATTTTTEKSSWIADSGCSLHMTNQFAWISEYRSLIVPINIHLGDDQVIQSKGFGKVKTSIGIIHNVHFVPKIKNDLFSMPFATDRGL